MKRPYLGAAEEEREERVCRNGLHFRIPDTRFEVSSLLCHFPLKLTFLSPTMI